MELSRLFEGKKFMWDGRAYDNESAAREQAQTYKADGFEVGELAEEGKYYLFTRRVVVSVP
ncbi:hypothetical protein ABFB09_02290 [Dehalogenimonas sp. THU2]|uniref:hypothetical protein n=1 Tax=Dehalogenimonas sp. THU2 TaxID=3151121 RepID=UPI003218150B